MEQIIKRGGALGALEVKIGMPHRGRLNILTNVLQKPLKKMFKEFSGEPGRQVVEYQEMLNIT